jgi:hypothetical protein
MSTASNLPDHGRPGGALNATSDRWNVSLSMNSCRVAARPRTTTTELRRWVTGTTACR